MQNLSSISQLPEVVDLNIDPLHEFLEVSMRIDGKQSSQKVSLSSFVNWLDMVLFNGKEFVDVVTDQNIDGIKTFTSTPRITTASGENPLDAINVEYLNSVISSNSQVWEFVCDDGSTIYKNVLASDI